jgi:uncharacterized protein YndB with AHSA1/START domain
MHEVTAQVERKIHASPTDVWCALTQPASLKRCFFGADVETVWQVGSSVQIKSEVDGKKYEDRGEVLVVEPPQRLSFSHWSAMSGKADAPENYHIVTFNLVPESNETKVLLTQANLVGGVTSADVTNRPEYEETWSKVLDGLEQLFPH